MGLWERVAGEELGLVWKGVGLAGVPRGSRPSSTYNPLISHTATCRPDDEKQLFTATEVTLLTTDGKFEIALAVKDGDRQDKQETPDSRDF